MLLHPIFPSAWHSAGMHIRLSGRCACKDDSCRCSRALPQATCLPDRAWCQSQSIALLGRAGDLVQAPCMLRVGWRGRKRGRAEGLAGAAPVGSGSTGAEPVPQLLRGGGYHASCPAPRAPYHACISTARLCLVCTATPWIAALVSHSLCPLGLSGRPRSHSLRGSSSPVGSSCVSSRKEQQDAADGHAQLTRHPSSLALAAAAALSEGAALMAQLYARRYDLQRTITAAGGACGSWQPSWVEGRMGPAWQPDHQSSQGWDEWWRWTVLRVLVGPMCILPGPFTHSEARQGCVRAGGREPLPLEFQASGSPVVQSHWP